MTTLSVVHCVVSSQNWKFVATSNCLKSLPNYRPDCPDENWLQIENMSLVTFNFLLLVTINFLIVTFNILIVTFNILSITFNLLLLITCFGHG